MKIFPKSLAVNCLSKSLFVCKDGKFIILSKCRIVFTTPSVPEMQCCLLCREKRFVGICEGYQLLAESFIFKKNYSHMPDCKQKWKIKSNEFIFSIEETEIEGTGTCIIEKSPAAFNCIKDNRSVNAFIQKEDSTLKKVKVEIEGEVFEVELKDELDQMLDEMGFSKAISKQIKEVKAPMPGMVLEITVKEGQQVKEGDKLLILGAMKMENAITISAAAIIKRIAVKAGQAVEKGQVLVELE